MIRQKKWKYLIGLLAAVVLVIAMSVTAFAEPADNNEITFEVESSVEDHDVALSWMPVEGIEFYRVYDMFGKELTTDPIEAPDFTDDTLEIEPITFQIGKLECSTFSYKYVVKGFAMKEVLPPEEPGDPDEPGNPDVPGDPVDPTGVNIPKNTDGLEKPDLPENPKGTVLPHDSEEPEYVETEICAVDVSVKVWHEPTMPVIESCKFVSQSEALVQWSESEGAIAYNVYRKDGNGEWKYIVTVPENSYLDTAVKLGKDYAYRVRAISDCCKNLSEYEETATKAFYVKATTVSSVTAPNASSVKAVWNAVDGATGYKVYMKIADGSWSMIADTTSTSYTKSLADSNWGKTIYFKVVAYCDDYNALDSNTKSTVFQPQAPVLKSATQVSSKKNTITWEKVDGVYGYKVYRKNADGTWKSIKTIADASTLSYSDTSISIGSTYEYTVAGYWKSGDKTETGYYNSKGLQVKPIVTIKYKEVTDTSSIMYGKKLKLYCDADGNTLQNSEEFVSASRYYLYVNKDKQFITAYVKEDGYYVPVRAMICSTGKTMGDTPNGTFSITQKIKTHELNGPCWGWYCSRFLTHHLFHSVPYKWNDNDWSDNKRLNVSYYNKLGSRASQGCIRLTTGDAKWIYDKCKVGTTVIIHQKKGFEPLQKPVAFKLDKSHNWDPTSPWGKDKCKELGCHDVD